MEKQKIDVYCELEENSKSESYHILTQPLKFVRRARKFGFLAMSLPFLASCANPTLNSQDIIQIEELRTRQAEAARSTKLNIIPDGMSVEAQVAYVVATQMVRQAEILLGKNQSGGAYEYAANVDKLKYSLIGDLAGTAIRSTVGIFGMLELGKTIRAMNERTVVEPTVVRPEVIEVRPEVIQVPATPEVPEIPVETLP